MAIIDSIIDRVKTQGYRYEREFLDIKAMPATVRNRTCYINMADGADADNETFRLRSTSAIKMMRTGFVLNFVDERKGIDIGEYTGRMKTAVTALLANTGANKLTGVPLIEITRTSYVETGEYIVFVAEINITEVLS